MSAELWLFATFVTRAIILLAFAAGATILAAAIWHELTEWRR